MDWGFLAVIVGWLVLGVLGGRGLEGKWFWQSSGPWDGA
jgi:hypothetical protein